MDTREQFEKEWNESNDPKNGLDMIFRRAYVDKSDKSFILWLSSNNRVLNDMLGLIQKEVDRLENKNNELMKYAQHLQSCRTQQGEQYDCDCGIQKATNNV